jgi:hypothetical protein
MLGMNILCSAKPLSSMVQHSVQTVCSFVSIAYIFPSFFFSSAEQFHIICYADHGICEVKPLRYASCEFQDSLGLFIIVLVILSLIVPLLNNRIPGVEGGCSVFL